MTWISLVGITLAVFALIATLAVRAGFRAEFVDTILGANAHVTVYSAGHADEKGNLIKGFAGPAGIADGVTATQITDWLKADFGLGHGHAMAIFALLKGKTS